MTGATTTSMAAPTITSLLSGTFNARDFGATGDGNQDDTAALQAAINAAAAVGGGTVEVPPTATGYRCDGRLTVREYVTLRGSAIAPPAGTYNRAGTGQTLRGSELRTTANAGSTDPSLAFLTLNRGAAVHGLTVFYPQQTQTNPPVSYPPAITFAYGHASAAVRNTLLVNPYRGLWCEGHDKPVIDGVVGQPLNRGLHLDFCTDVARVRHVHFWAGYWKEYVALDPLETYMWTNAEAIHIGRADECYFSDCFSFGYAAGFRLTSSSTAGHSGEAGYGSFTNCGVDGCNRGIAYEASAVHGYTFAGSTVLATAGNNERCVIASSGTVGGLRLVGVALRGTNAANLVEIQADSGATFQFDSCLFGDWRNQANDAAILVASTSAVVLVAKSVFTASTGYQLDAQMAKTGYTGAVLLAHCRQTGGQRYHLHGTDPIIVASGGNV